MQSRKIESASELKSGNHIYFQSFLYEHHGIVTNVFPDESIFHLIHLNDSDFEKESGKLFLPCECQKCISEGLIKYNKGEPKFMVKKEVFKMEPGQKARCRYSGSSDSSNNSPDVYVLEYHKKLPASQIVLNAQSHLHERKYDIVTYNCEHFAFLCTKGVLQSFQLENPVIRSAVKAGQKFGSF